MQSPQPSLDPAYRFSGLAQWVDPAYPTNKAILLFAPIAFFLGAMHAYLGGSVLVDTAQAGLNAALLLFFTWALTRELSPDDNVAAFMAMGVALALWPKVGAQSIMTLLVLVLAARLINRSTGKAATKVDSVLAVAGFAAMAWFSSWVFGVVGILAFALDAVLPCVGRQPRRRDHLGFAAALVLVTGARLIVGIEPLGWPPFLLGFAAITGLCGFAILLYPRPRSIGDVDQRLLVHVRVRAAMAVGLLGTVLLSVDSGFYLFKILGVWACVLAVPVGLPIMLARRR